MSATLRSRSEAGPTSLAAAFVLFAGWATGGMADAASDSTTSPAAIVSASPERTGALRIAIRIGGDTAMGTLADTSAARGFAAMLPVTIDTRDLFGQAKAGELPRALAADDTAGVSGYAVGDLGYWSPSGDLAIFYADDGQSLPPPGLVRLGTVDTELTAVADAGNRSRMTIELAD
jgi:hypothetical protein